MIKGDSVGQHTYTAGYEAEGESGRNGGRVREATSGERKNESIFSLGRRVGVGESGSSPARNYHFILY